MNAPPCVSAITFVSAAVSVVLPWSTCPIVPTFTCGLVRSNFSLDIAKTSGWRKTQNQKSTHIRSGADDRDRTGDLVLTKDVLYQLSYVSGNSPGRVALPMERVMGIEPTPSAWKAEVLPLNYTRLVKPPRARKLFLSTDPPAASRNFSGRSSPWWWGKDSNLRRRKLVDLQSAPVDRLGTPPGKTSRVF